MLVVEIDEKVNADRDPDYEKKRQKDLEKIDYYVIKLILIKNVSVIMKNLVEYKSKLMNQLKNKLKNQLKNH